MSTTTQAIPFDRELVRKYDRPGPRYTSYPTAPWFRDDFGSADYARLLIESHLDCGGDRAGDHTGAALPLSVYVHLPFCETRCYFCGCNVVISRSKDRAREYLALLDREMAAVAELAGAAGRETVQIHWGGGTPTFLPPEELAALMASIRRRFRLAPGCEIGVEVDPRRLTEAHLDALAAAGVNRLSMGVQDLDAVVQRAVNRVQPAEETWSALAGARERGMTSVNLDLVYGLPHQTPASFGETVDEVIRMSPDRIAVFNFAYLPELFPHQRTLDERALPDAEDRLTILEETVGRLTGAGYAFIGMDHFAKPEDPLAKALADRSLTRNFQGYSTCGATDLLGFGVSAISQVAGGFSQNVKELADYAAALEAGRLPVGRGLAPSPEDRLRRDVILAIMGRFHLDWDEIETAHGIEFDRHFAAEIEALEPLAADGLVELGARALRVTPLGRLLVRNVAMVFDEYLARPSEVRYSRTV